MEEIIQYKAKDGAIFDNWNECMLYELNINDMNKKFSFKILDDEFNEIDFIFKDYDDFIENIFRHACFISIKTQNDLSVIKKCLEKIDVNCFNFFPKMIGDYYWNDEYNDWKPLDIKIDDLKEELSKCEKAKEKLK